MSWRRLRVGREPAFGTIFYRMVFIGAVTCGLFAAAGVDFSAAQDTPPPKVGQATDDKTTDDKTTDDKATDDKATDDKATDDKATDDKATDDKATDDKATDDKTTDDKTTDDKTTDDKTTDDKTTDDKTTDDKTTDDKTTDDKTTDDKTTDDKAIQEKIPVEAGPDADEKKTDADAELRFKRRATFIRLDTDGNNKLSRDEYAAGHKSDLNSEMPEWSFDDINTGRHLKLLTFQEFEDGFSFYKQPWYVTFGVVLLVIVAPFVAGGYISRAIGMRDYSTRISTILVILTASAVVAGLNWPPKLGIDLKGGVNLIYQIDRSKLDGDLDMDEMVAAISKRVNPGGQLEVVIRAFGQNEIEIIIPGNMGSSEVESIKRKVITQGMLEFRILCNPNSGKHAALTKAAEDSKPSDKKVIARGGIRGDWVEIDPDNFLQFHNAIKRTNEKTGNTEVLLVESQDEEGGYIKIGGADIKSAYEEMGNEGKQVIFKMNPIGGKKLGALTSKHEPEGSSGDAVTYRMAIVFDDKLTSAPTLQSTISDVGQITGISSPEDRKLIVEVLNAGRLPAALMKTPASEFRISATLGHDTILKGAWSIGVSGVCVLLFMIFYYRFSGILACVALLMNMLIVMGVIIGVNAALTLPGLAGLVLTIGMAVDANVLIFERIREELDRGTALRMAIRNGFDKATTTIVDANLTTLITAVVLYWIGTDQIKGFAVTLIVGILASMFTAIYCSRAIFEIFERKGWIKQLSMSRILGKTEFDFLGKRKLAGVLSAVLILVGLVGVSIRGLDILDIDFTGGTSINVLFDGKKVRELDDGKAMTIAAVREKTNNLPDVTVSEVVFDEVSEDGAADPQFKIDTSIGSEVSMISDFKDRDTNQDGKLTEAEYLEGIKKFIDGDTLHLVDRWKVRFALLDQVSESEPGDGQLTAKEFKLTDQDLKFILEELFGERLKVNTLTFAVTSGSDGATKDNAPKTSRITNPNNNPTMESVRPAHVSSKDRRDSKDFQDETMRRRLVKSETNDSGAQADPGDPKKDAPDNKPVEKESAEKKIADPKTDKKSDDKKAENSSADEKKAAERKTGAPGTDNKKLTDKNADDAKSDDPKADDPKAGDPKTDDPKAGDPKTDESVQTALTFALSQEISKEELSLRIVEAAGGPAGSPVGLIESLKSGMKDDDVADLRTWNVVLALDEKAARSVAEKLANQLASEPDFPAANTIGGAVAGKTKTQAIYALVFSLIAIVAYIWFRFQHVVFGLAAVAALVHDVLITLGALALSAFVATELGVIAKPLLIDAFKISLPTVAAFLTIVGYSLNDTIVVFDRIREVRGKSPQLTKEMLNSSINQTLSRTLLTSLTTLVVVLILYSAGGQGIHSFAFALVVGVIVGTYSSVFVASPVLLWLSDRQAAASAK